jgi:hypothetical protein
VLGLRKSDRAVDCYGLFSSPTSPTSLEARVVNATQQQQQQQQQQDMHSTLEIEMGYHDGKKAKEKRRRKRRENGNRVLKHWTD